jgi:cytochrome c-type biogenesis protein
MVALLAGIISSGVCPCTLPVGLGMAGLVSSSSARTRTYNRGFLIALAFFSGIVVCLMLLGALAGRLGVLLTESFGRYWALMMVFISLAAALWHSMALV